MRNKNTKLRTPETWERYCQNKREDCFFCADDAPVLFRFRHWVLIDNNFPYDAIASKHHMLAPVRHIGDQEESTRDEGEEFQEIMKMLQRGESYDTIMQNFPKAQTVPDHLHLHLLTWKRE